MLKFKGTFQGKTLYGFGLTRENLEPAIPTFTHGVTGKEVKPKPWKWALGVGDCYVIDDAKAWVGDESIGMGAVYGELLERLEPGVFNARAYSSYCPSGEIGPVTVVEVSHKISREQFEAQVKRLRIKP